MTTATAGRPYAATLQIDYPDRPLNRLTSAFRLIWVIPIVFVQSLLSTGVALATAVMIVFRQKYPRWWFDFARESTRFSARVGAYGALMTDVYPSTTDEQSVHLEIRYPDAEQDLNRWMPLFKWFLAIPHYIVLYFLLIAALVAIVIAWFAILFTGRYPRGLFNFVQGVGRWAVRVAAYMALLVTDEYPPFSLS